MGVESCVWDCGFSLGPQGLQPAADRPLPGRGVWALSPNIRQARSEWWPLRSATGIRTSIPASCGRLRLTERGNTFETLLKGQVEQFLKELAVVNLLAEKNGIQLTSQEKDAVQNLTDEYYSGLTKGDLDYMKVSKDEVYDLYSKYYLADKTVSQLTNEEDLEVSDAEAKVIHIQQIETDTEEKAQEVYEKATQEKADFAAVAAKESQNSQIEYELEWSGDMTPLEQSAFSLEQDQISKVISYEGKYYIQKCTNAYDKDATAARKIKLLEEKKARAFDQIYTPFSQTNPVRLKEGMWDEMDFSGGEECTADNFSSCITHRASDRFYRRVFPDTAFFC
mgnify:CR=1 FL=1